MKSIHGKEVIAMITNSTIKREELITTIEEKFKDTRFYVCSKENLTAKELLEFLENAKKLYFEDGIAKMHLCDECKKK